MPLYDYECLAGHVTEHFYKISDKPKQVACSECGLDARTVLAMPHIPSMVGKGDYADHNLEGEHDDPRKPFIVTGPEQRKRRMREVGAIEIPPSARVRERRRLKSRHTVS